MTDISLYFCIHLVFDELKKLTEQWLSTRKYVTVYHIQGKITEY